MPRLGPMWWLALVLALPFVELWTLLELGSAVGVWATLAWCVAGGLVGVWLMRHARVTMTRRVHGGEVAEHGPRAVLGDGLLLVAGALIAFPGLVSDALGLLLTLPFVRAAVIRWVGRRAAKAPGMGRGAARQAGPRPAPKGSAPDVEIYPPGSLRPPQKRRPVIIDVD